MKKSDVYFLPLNKKTSDGEVSAIAAKLLEHILQQEQITPASHLALKVHFGESGNRTYIHPECYDGILEVLKNKNIEASFIETSVLYGGNRRNAESHKKLAKDHGFTKLPVIIADGVAGEDSSLIPIEGGKHFKTCALGKGFEAFEQLLVLSHFKGHSLAGFGGAIKQLSMGFASKGGKMAMHMGIKPKLMNFLCVKCGLCTKRCQVDAIHIEPKGSGKKSSIDHSKCLGCGACYSACPRHAISILSLRGIRNMLFRKSDFREKLVEYALAAHQGRRNIYMNFAMSITKGCDCEPRPMLAAIPNIGIFVSTDPVAADAACYDACVRSGLKFKGGEQLAYAEKLGLGSRDYNLITLNQA